MYHLAVCVEREGQRHGLVISAENEARAVQFAEAISPRVGYVGNSSFAEAVRRAGMMERDEPGAWGWLPKSQEAPHV